MIKRQGFAFKKILVVATVVTLMSLSLVGCGTKKPNGSYSNSGISFDFSKNSVVVVEGESKLSSDYTIDSNGKITLTIEDQKMTITYDKDNDEIICGGLKYTK